MPCGKDPIAPRASSVGLREQDRSEVEVLRQRQMQTE